MNGLREFSSAAEMRAFYAELHERFRNLQPPPMKKPIPWPLAPAPKPQPPSPRPPLPIMPAPWTQSLLGLRPMQRIIKTVADHYRVEPAEILSVSRKARVLVPRQVAAYLGRDLLGLS